MKTAVCIFAAFLGLLLACGCSSTTNWDLPQGFDYNHRMDTIQIQIEYPTVSQAIPQGLAVDPAIVKKLNTFLYDKFASSARFRILTGLKDIHKENKVLHISPVLGFHRQHQPSANFYFCQTSISCRLLDLEEGTLSENGADTIGPISKYCRNSIVVPIVYGQEHFNVESIDMNTMFNDSFELVWPALEAAIARKFPANAKIAKVATFGSTTRLSFPGGVANGFHNDDIFKVYAVRDGMVTVVALASGQIGKTASTLTVVEWNMDDPVVREVYYPQMLRNDAAGLYVVAEEAAAR